MRPTDFPWADDQSESKSAEFVRVKWLGVAGYELTCEGTTLLLDPYLSRVSFRQFLFSRLDPDHGKITRSIKKADGIVVGHSHFDHLMDVPVIAKSTGATVWGSKSTANLLRASGVPEAQIRVCDGRETFDVGPFKVEVIPSEHSRFLFGKVPNPGEIPCSCDVPMKASDYKVGDVFGIRITVGGLSFYHCGSANLIDEELKRGDDVDVLLMCIAGRHATQQFIPRILKRVDPRIVVPMHYDNFFRSKQKTLQLLPKIAFGRLVDEVTAFNRDIQLAALDFDGTVSLKL